MQFGRATNSRLVLLRVSLALLVVVVLAWSLIDHGRDTSPGSAGEVSEHNTSTARSSLPATHEQELTFDDSVHRQRRQEYVEILKDDTLARLAPRWDSLYTGLDAVADSASLAIKFRELDSLWDASGSDEQL